ERGVDRIADIGVVALQVFRRQQSAVAIEVLDHHPGRLAFVKLTRPLLSDAPQRASIVRLYEPLTCLVDAAVLVKVDLTAGPRDAECGRPVQGFQETRHSISARHPQPMEVRVDLETIRG